jgi:hypothetical protein
MHSTPIAGALSVPKCSTNFPHHETNGLGRGYLLQRGYTVNKSVLTGPISVLNCTPEETYSQWLKYQAA